MGFLGRVLLEELIDPVDVRILILLNSSHGFTGRHSLVTPKKGVNGKITAKRPFWTAVRAGLLF